MPLVSFFRSSKRSNKENVPQAKNTAKVVESSMYTGPSPYSVVTQPKKFKGPRSCPGAPMDDSRFRSHEEPFSERHAHLNNSVRYENLPRRRFDSFDDGRYRRSTARPTYPVREEKNCYDSRYQHESFESEDDDYQGFIHMKSQIAELTKEEKKMRDRCRDYKRRLEDVHEEAEYYRRNFERQSHALDKVRKTLDNERKQRAIAEYKNKELTEAYKQANEKIMDLEEKLNFFERPDNDHSLSEEGGASGAGEALCEQNDACSRDMINSDTPSISMFSDGNLDQEKDEVRVFHPQDSDECDLDEEADTPEIEVERSLRASPVELLFYRSSSFLSKGGKFGSKSLSDTNLNMLTSEDQDTKNSSDVWMTSFKSLDIKDDKLIVNQDSPMFSSSSDDDAADLAFQQQQYEKQLRKIGEAVKYKPPRKAIAGKYFRRYARPERAAIETLNFLDDMSSDASGLLSSPDFVVNNSRIK